MEPHVRLVCIDGRYLSFNKFEYVNLYAMF